jgi:AcrR family transcriptional regulator
MKKTDQTKRRIVTAAATLFNRKGYAGTHIRDIMEATGLAKGGIYGNFSSKEEIEVEAFAHALRCVREPLVEELGRHVTAPEKLHALLRVYERYASSPPVPGGCPILNTSVEADDAHQRLRRRVVKALDGWATMIADIVKQGKSEGTIREDIDAADLAVHFIATIEGAIMLAKAYGGDGKLVQALRPLHRLIDEELVRADT